MSKVDYVKTYLTHLGRNTEEQIQKNQPLIAWLQSRGNEELSEDEIREGKEEFELLKQIIDEGRESESKIFL